MSHIGQVEPAVVFAPILADLNKGKGTNAQEFPVLKTTKQTAQEWWDSLRGEKYTDCGTYYSDRVAVGSIAIHFHKMSANYPWVCNLTKYTKLRKSQRKIIDFVFAQRNENYSMFYLPAILKL